MKARRAVAMVALLLAAGCATAPFPATELTETTPTSAAQLVGGLWSAKSGALMVRQSALFEFRGMRVPVAGIMRLDLGKRQARLVGMNDMGMKLYDISVDEKGSSAHFLLPDLARYPGFADAVALSVRRIFLAPLPAPGDRLETAARSYRLSRQEGAAVAFTVGGAQRQLLEKEMKGADQSWRVRYYRYQSRQGTLFPGGIVLEDDRAGYRLTLWTESVERADESD